jgi:hypothetical protein
VQNKYYGIFIFSGFNTTIQFCNFSKNEQTNLWINPSTPLIKVYDSEFEKINSQFIHNIFTQDLSTLVDHNHYSDYRGFDDLPDFGIGDIPYKVNSSEGIDVFDNNPWFDDADNDNVDRFVEQYYNTNPLVADSDADGLTDYQEIFAIRAFLAEDYTFIISPTNPLVNDTDGDGLTDSEEMIIHKTNPNTFDTDGDGFSDKEEIDAGSNPLDPLDWPGRSDQQYDFGNVEDLQKEAIADRSIQSIPGYPTELIAILSILAIFIYIKVNKHGSRHPIRNNIGGGNK